MNTAPDDEVAVPTRPLDRAQLWESSESPSDVLALVILWSALEPERVGEVALLPCEGSTVYVLGRAPDSAADPGSSGRGTAERPVRFFRQRPIGVHGATEPTEESCRLRGPAISRRQVTLQPGASGLIVDNIGQCPLFIDGKPAQPRQVVAHGSTLHLENQLLLYCTQRPIMMPPLRSYPTARIGAYGEPDADGIVGECPVTWRLREELAILARTDFHILILGESGSGKELAAQAIHRMSSRAGEKLIADNVSTMPSELAPAILFGNRKNFPQMGMEERIGLIGLANSSTLFLDEIGDMPEKVQPMLLRVTEKNGDYCRLGEEHRRLRSNFRLIGATNREEQMRHELRRRFQRAVRIPLLQERREDIPLLLSYLLREQQAHHTSPVELHYVVDGQLRLPPALLDALVRRDYSTHVSEVSFCLGHITTHRTLPSGATRRKKDEPPTVPPLERVQPRVVTPPAPAVAHEPAQAPPPAPPVARTAAERPSPAAAQQALYECNGNVSHAAKKLGISRQQLNRMITEYGLRVERSRGRHYDLADGDDLTPAESAHKPGGA